jgi:hypothetical protein
MSYSQIVALDTLRYIAGSGLTTTYQKFGSSLAFPMRLSCLSCNYTTDILIAITNGSTPASDGTADKMYVPAGGFKLFDLTTNKVDQQQSVFCIQAGQQLWIRTSPNAPGVYAEFIYGLGET